MMVHKTPEWLLETQNKSWEPEIIISGITLTFVFLLPNHIFNFFGMLVQDHGVYDVIARNLFMISMTMLTGLKIVLIIHLVLRGLWTGFIGLSYVYPAGVKTEKLPKSQRDIEFQRPEYFVIKIERVCSLLFSFIFSTIMFVLGLLLLFVPITLLFFTGLDMEIIHKVTLYGVLPGMIGMVLLLAILSETKLMKSKLKGKLENTFLQHILAIYFTNIGKAKTSLVFIVYAVLILALSYSDISSFSFENDVNLKPASSPGIVQVDRNKYEASRDQRLRIQRATVDQFRVADNSLDLFVGFYKEDVYTVKIAADNTELRQEYGLGSADEELWVQNLLTVVVDDVPIDGLRWYFTEHPRTGQPGLMTSIPLNKVAPGLHGLTIRKLIWSVEKKKMELFDKWDIMPFEIAAPE